MEKYFSEAINTCVTYKEIPEFMPTGEFEGIKAITYDGAKWEDKKTKVFAYLGFPENVSRKVPAIVLVHGGAGVAFLPWVKMWNDRGYAAIAMSTTGDFPLEVNAGGELGSDLDTKWQHGLYGVFAEDGYIDAPKNDEMGNFDKPFSEQWMPHAMTQVIYAHNILRSDERVDSDRIGITGISWGGVITSLTVGYDKRFAFAAPVYGSGYLTESLGFVGDFFRKGTNPDKWLAEKRFDDVNIPILWVCWNADQPFSLNSNSKSYEHTFKNNSDNRLCMVDGLGHSHERGWIRQEIEFFADSVCKNTTKLANIKYEDKKIILDMPQNAELVSVKLYSIDEPMSYNTPGDYNLIYMDQQWKIDELDIKASGESFEIPDYAKVFYFELTTKIDGEEYITTSKLFD